MIRRAASAALLALTVAVAAAGCSQIAAIAPVGGDRLAEVRYAVNDVLIEERIDILVAPVCAVGADEATVTCEGSTRDARTITAVSEAEPSDRIVVRVSDEIVYRGSLTAVLERGSSG